MVLMVVLIYSFGIVSDFSCEVGDIRLIIDLRL